VRAAVDGRGAQEISFILQQLPLVNYRDGRVWPKSDSADGGDPPGVVFALSRGGAVATMTAHSVPAARATEPTMPEPLTTQQPGASAGELPLLNPHARVSVVPIHGEHRCIVIDDFMLEPEALVDYAARNHAHFVDDPRNYYPGPELPLGGTLAARIRDSFLEHARAPLKARRLLGMASRLSLVTRRPDQVLPAQRLPHRDSDGLPAGEGMCAMVLYLFEDERFGGTSFFKPAVPMPEIAALLRELKRRELAGEAPPPSPEEGPPTFAIGSSRWFEKVLTIAPRYNRAIFYDGAVFHSGDLHAPALMVNDPRAGRLTVNAFFRVRMAAG
jgi:hypothetical protein